MQAPTLFRKKRPFIFLNSSVSKKTYQVLNVRANHAENYARKGCAMQLNGITRSEQRIRSKRNKIEQI